jgi:type II secretory pathway predicted ATPase ExeA
MYLTHFGLSDKPFKSGWDPKYLWLGAKHREILTALAHGVLQGDGLQVVTGDEGTGKTALANALLKELGERVVAAIVPCPEYEGIDLLKLIAKAWGIGGASADRESLIARAFDFLSDARSAGKKALLIIDDAHRMTQPRLRVLSDLSGLEENSTRLLHLVLFGESPLDGILDQESNRELAQKITFRDALSPLTREETAQYILHRLKVAQCEREIFTPGAIDEIFLYSSGVPGLINKACDVALSRSFYIGETIIQPGTIRNFMKLMPDERGTRVRGAAERPPAASSAPQGGTEVEGRGPEVAGPVPTETGQRMRKRAAYAALGCFMAVAVGFTLYVMTGSEQPAPAKPASTNVGAPLPESRVTNRDGQVPGSAVSRSDSTSQPLPSGTSVSIRGAVKKETQTVKEKRRQAPGSVTMPRREETATREVPSTAAGEPDPDKVIDWMLKKRSEKR